MTTEYTLNVTDASGDTINVTLTTDGGTDSATIESITGTVDGVAVTGLNTSYYSGDNILYPTEDASAVDYGGTEYGPFTAYLDFDGLSFEDANGDQINLYGETNNSYALIFSSGGTGGDVSTFELTALCFCAGTRIATPDGEIAVEALKAGDMVRTASGEAKPVRWLGRSDISARFAAPLKAAPIRILAGAFGEGLPARDLRLSPAHALFLNGVLVEAQALVNGSTILREAISEDFSYYHVELESHELILAEGLAAESFVDNAERMNFSNWEERIAPAAPIQEMAYPRAKSTRQIPARVRAAVATRCAALAPNANAA